jgi:hypothetical protein
VAADLKAISLGKIRTIRAPATTLTSQSLARRLDELKRRGKVRCEQTRERIKLFFEWTAGGGKIMPVPSKPFTSRVRITDGLMHYIEFQLAGSKIAANPPKKLITLLVKFNRFRKFAFVEHMPGLACNSYENAASCKARIVKNI